MDQSDDNTEIWKPVVGWEDRYIVSNLGRVHSLGKRGTFIKQICNANGRMVIQLHRGTVAKNASVHTLVAEAFIYPRPKGKEVNHQDGIPTNNRASNLEWITHPENIKHGIKIGTNYRLPVNAKLSEEQVREIKRELACGVRVGVLAKRYGVVHATISNIRTGKTWFQTTAPVRL